MENSLPLWRKGALCGSLQVSREGLMTCFRAELKDPGPGLFRAWILGEDGRLLLGVMEPVGQGLLRVERAFSRDALKRANLGSILGAEVRQEGAVAPEWQRVERPGRLLRDRRLAASAHGPCLVCRQGEGILLLFPWKPGQPFPMTPLFCFARPERREGQMHLRFHIDKNGFPLL